MIVVPAIFLQITWSFFILGLLNNLLSGNLGDILEIIFSILAIIFVTGLVSKRDEGSYKLLWVMTIVNQIAIAHKHIEFSQNFVYALTEIDGVKDVNVELSSGTATVSFDKEVADEVLKEKVKTAGYTVKEIK